MFKHKRPSSSAKQLIKPKTIKNSESSADPHKKTFTLIKSKQATPRKPFITTTHKKLPRTCVETPTLSPNPHNKRQSSHVSHKPSIRITEIIRVSHIKPPKSLPIKPYLNITDILVSPIQKVHIAFLNNEDNSMISALEVLSNIK